MCEYCGCQALKAVDLLTREHEFVVNLIGRIREAVAAGDIARVADLARAIGGVLVPHTRVEEDGLFPLMDAEFPDHVAVLRAEHRQVEEVLAEAANGTPSDGLWPQRLTAALYLLREHILKEQDGLFPAALACLGPQEWDAVDDLRSHVSSGLSSVSAATTA